MGEIVLPTGPVAPRYTSPRKHLLYGVPKVGKTTAVAQLPDNLIIDLEDGTDMVAATAVKANSIAQIGQILAKINEESVKRKAAGQRELPYRYITIDTADALEEMCDVSALAKFKKSGKCSAEQRNTLTSITELPHGLGYFYLRDEFKFVVNEIGKYCERLILITHVKDKLINEKQGATATVKDISLGGKLSSIVCANMDAIGYLYRKPDSDKLWVSYQSFDTNTTMGSRCPHLAGKTMELDWSKIYID